MIDTKRIKAQSTSCKVDGSIILPEHIIDGIIKKKNPDKGKGRNKPKKKK